MQQTSLRPVLIAYGKILEVLVDTANAIFLDVELVHYARTDTEALTARVRWAVPYHGEGFSDHYVPEVGRIVFCAFPGFGQEGGGGGDLDDGVALVVLPGQPAPLPEGQKGPLGEDRRVLVTREDEAQDLHVQGDLDLKVDGPADLDYEDTRDTTVSGDDVLNVPGERTENLGTLVQNVSGNKNENVTGNRTEVTGTRNRTVTGAEVVSNLSTFVRNVAGTFSMLGQGLVQLFAGGMIRMNAGTKFGVNAASVNLGSENATLRLMTEAMILVYNTHTHVGVATGAGVSGIPVVPLIAGVETTTTTKAT